jgi:hypothetical protein
VGRGAVGRILFGSRSGVSDFMCRVQVELDHIRHDSSLKVNRLTHFQICFPYVAQFYKSAYGTIYNLPIFFDRFEHKYSMFRKTLRELYDENIRVLADFVGADPKNLGIQDYSFRIKII